MTGVGVGAGGADTTGLGAAADGWPGGVQPGGGTKALLGSAGRTGGIAAAGASADANTIGEGADAGAGAAVPTATDAAV